MKSEHKKLTIVGALLVIAVGVYWFWGRPRSPISEGIAFVCVATGQTFQIDRDDLPSTYPARNPDTGQRTLLPYLARDGKRYLSPRYAGYLARLEEEKVNKYVDPETLEILDAPRP